MHNSRAASSFPSFSERPPKTADTRVSLSLSLLSRSVFKTSCLAGFMTLLIDDNMWPFKARASATVGAFGKVRD
jgi:hypothetical protein